MTDSLDPIVAALATGVLPFEAAVAYAKNLDRGVSRAWKASVSLANVQAVLAKMAATDLAVYLRAGAAVLQLLVPRLDDTIVKRELRDALRVILKGEAINWLIYEEAASDASNKEGDEATTEAFVQLVRLAKAVRRRDRDFASLSFYDVNEHASEALIYPLSRGRRAEVYPRLAQAIVKRVAPPTAAILGIA